MIVDITMTLDKGDWKIIISGLEALLKDVKALPDAEEHLERDYRFYIASIEDLKANIEDELESEAA